MTEPKSTRCADCMYAVRVSDSGPLRCHRNAPVPTELAGPMTSHWPTVGAGDWCGDWMDYDGRSLFDIARDTKPAEASALMPRGIHWQHANGKTHTVLGGHLWSKQEWTDAGGIL